MSDPSLDRPILDRPTLRPTVMTVALSSLSNNLSAVRDKLGDCKLMAVVKANAYGHGLIPCAKHFVASGVDYLGVAFVEEGIELRKAGIKQPILVFGGIFDSQIKHFIEYDLDLTASSIGKLQGIEKTAAQLGKKARVHLKVDTGMERIGVHYYSAEPFLKTALDMKNCDIVGVFSHLATAAEDSQFARVQIERFSQCVEYTKQEFLAAGVALPMFHIANSAGAILYPEAQFDMVRCGIALYGVYPDSSLRSEISLTPAMKLLSRVVYFKVVRKGAGVGYGQTWIAPEDTRVVTIPIGYGDGYFRSLSNRGEVLIGGKRFPIVGRISMDQIMVNVGQDSVYVGDEVVLIGSQGSEEISVGELADKASSYSYEMLTATNMRVPRVYENVEGTKG